MSGSNVLVDHILCDLKKDLGLALSYIYLICGLFLLFCLHQFLYTICVPGTQRGHVGDARSPESELDGCELLCCYWELNIGPLPVIFKKAI